MSSSAVEKFTLVFEFDILKITVLKKYLPIEIGRYFYRVGLLRHFAKKGLVKPFLERYSRVF